jgi:cellulose biosynthesis protein BcsQ
MKTLTVASGKGGTGKSIIAASIAAQLAARSRKERVAMIDLNSDQATLTQWWIARGRGVSPYLLQDGNSSLIVNVRALRKDGYAWCVIDCPPTDTVINEVGIMVSDFVVVPVRLAFFDASATQSIVETAKQRRKPFAFLVNAFDARPAFKKPNAEALALLASLGPIFKTRLPYSAKFIEGQSAGKTPAEIDKPISDAFDALVEEIKVMLSTKGKPNG